LVHAQVKPHPCDRDYQHADGLVGCTPAQGNIRSRGAIGLVDMRTETRTWASPPKDQEYGAYAQTLRRDGFISMLGRPPFNYSDGSPMRGAGFMSTSKLTKGPNHDSIFKRCSSIDQCFKDQFTHHGREATRKVYTPVEALGISAATAGVRYFVRDWQPSDATRCGIAGFLVMDANGKGVNRMCDNTQPDAYYCCMVDASVAPLFYLFSKHGGEVLDKLNNVCNRPPLSLSTGIEIPASSASFQVFSRTKVQTIVSQIKDGYYSVPVAKNTAVQIKVIMGLLNDLLNDFSPPLGDIQTSLNYVQVVDCSVALYAELQAYTTCPSVKGVLDRVDSGPFCAEYHLSEGGGSNKRSSLYYFLQVRGTIGACIVHLCIVLAFFLAFACARVVGCIFFLFTILPSMRRTPCWNSPSPGGTSASCCREG
jgi:hypothetical protein